MRSRFNLYFRKYAVEQGAVFKNNRSQTVTLPKAVARPGPVKGVDAVAVDRSSIISPAGEPWESRFDGEGVTAAFMAARKQPAYQERKNSDGNPVHVYRQQLPQRTV
jgi:antitoxin VapB